MGDTDLSGASDNTGVAEEDMSLDRLMEVVYRELRALAAYHLQGERTGHTLQPTALVHEAYLRLAGFRTLQFQSKAHFLRIAATQIRRVLVDHARSRDRSKRSGKLVQVTLSEGLAAAGPEVDMLALNEALLRLDQNSTRDRQIVELKFFAGMTENEIASVLGISDRTVRRRWIFARAWLFRQLDAA